MQNPLKLGKTLLEIFFWGVCIEFLWPGLYNEISGPDRKKNGEMCEVNGLFMQMRGWLN